MQVQPLFSASEVAAAIGRVAEAIWRDDSDADLVLLCIAEGARRFADALCERLVRCGLEPELRSVRVRRTVGRTLGAVQVGDFDPLGLAHRDLVIVDDIADEGTTLRAVLDLVEDVELRSLRTAVLVNKTAARRHPLALDYVGFTVEDGWLVGFGMDVDGEFRELDEIGVVLDE
ncbi:MAG: hypothetical protein MJE66_21400 [Proteobacteria bacterium]|nr:hypothetical protein [Pseudomonadota bacterium]